jgi:hypothetical protein
MAMKRFSYLRLLISLLALGLLAAACSSSDTSSADDELATLQDAAPAINENAALAAPTTTAPEEGPLSFEDASLEFAACMRDEYPEWPDPDPEAGRRLINPEALDGLGIDFADEDFRAIIQECQGEFQGAGPGGQDRTAEEQAELEDNLLALFACLRENPGYEDIPDPDFSGGEQGFGLRELFTSGEIDPQEFRTLMQDCQSELGIEGGGGGLGGRARQPAASS